MGSILRWCVLLPSPPFSFLIFPGVASWRRHKPLLHDAIANNILLAPMRACLYLPPTARSTVLRER